VEFPAPMLNIAGAGDCVGRVPNGVSEAGCGLTTDEPNMNPDGAT